MMAFCRAGNTYNRSGLRIPATALKYCTLFFLLVCFSSTAFSQQDHQLASPVFSFPSRLLEKIRNKANMVEEKLMAQSTAALTKLRRQEKSMKKKLAAADSVAAEQIFGDIDLRYDDYLGRLDSASETAISPSPYLPSLDTLKTALNFVASNPKMASMGGAYTQKLNQSISTIGQLDKHLDKIANLKQVLISRKQALQQQLNGLGMTTELRRFQGQLLSYSQRLNGYLAYLEDPSQLQQKALDVIKELPAFQEFFKKHSELASLFRLQDDPMAMADFAGLQNRTSVMNLLESTLSSAGPNAAAVLQQSMTTAYAQLDKLKEKVNSLGGAADMKDELPDFKPDNEQTRSFLRRLEFGSNIQSQRSSDFFPTTTDIGLSIGYKLSTKGVIGIGASYKVGWGESIRKIKISHQGVGFRSFADYRIRGSFFASGGFEYNYQQPFRALFPTANFENWQQSGLVGISKIISIRSKIFKKTKAILFWDFLSYQQRPQGQPLKFRVGYNF